jgi:hypothetical protein
LPKKSKASIELIQPNAKKRFIWQTAQVFFVVQNTYLAFSAVKHTIMRVTFCHYYGLIQKIKSQIIDMCLDNQKNYQQIKTL